MQELYWAFMEAGYSSSLFWELTIGEANDMLIGYGERLKHEQKIREADLKDHVIALYHQAEQTANMISRILAGKHASSVKILPLTDYYPDLFREENEEAQAEKDRLELAARNERFKAFAERHNARIRGEEDGSGNGNDAGDAPGGDPGGDTEIQD